ncbi:DUF4270 domain-containing protein [Moheibacter sediminis]|uniref:DUF4270 domain-containing protein n=1 Tax=Moheibacter sediminis TaxID=1434700 RepID=A0A1W1Y940_9FLAO|nr:DUF4270 domain-containing protein [Moheibacter sediminis]SMC32730.1 protein of unknown function [Moheibacter sediminis]
MKRFFNVVAGAIVVLFTLSIVSCEDDISNVGSGLLDSGSTANVMYVDLVAYNTNSDSIRSDEKVLQNAILGVYEEPVFGRTKARFISQARLGTVNPDFGGNPEMDSVILSIPVYYKTAEADISIDTTYLYLAEGEVPTDTATMRVKRTYKLDSIYGRTDLPMTLQVREVGEYLYSQDSVYYSNKTKPGCNNCWGNINDIEVIPYVINPEPAIVTNQVRTYQVKKKNETTIQAPTVAISVKLDKNYFKQKFIDNGGSNLNDQASFIRNLFRGIELSVAEEQGFLFNFNPNAMSLTMYYTYDNPTDDTGNENYEARLQKTLGLSFTSLWASTPGFNVQLSQFEHTNRSNQFVNSYTNPNTVSGDSRLYLNGLDGTKSVIKFNQDQLNQIRQNVLENDWAVVGAELILHVDDSYNLKKPPYLFSWNQYKEEDKVKNLNFTDLTEFYNSYPLSVQFNPMYNYKDNPKTYIIRITDYIKSIVEKDTIYEEGSMILSMGNFLLNPTNSYTSIISGSDPFANNRAFNPHRIVLHGNATEQQDKKLQLKIYYTKK